MKMDDIARLAGVSASTVSRALNDSPLVSDATKARVREIAARCDYQVDQRARSLRLRKTHVVAVIIPLKTEQPLSDPFFLELLGTIADELTKRNYQMLLARVANLSDDIARSLLAAGRADGVLLIGQSTEHAAIERLNRRIDPLVVWGQRFPGQPYLTVGSDNIAGGRSVGAYFAACGYQRVAFIGDPELPEVSARLEGFQRAREAAGFEPELTSVHRCPFNGDQGYRAARALLRGDPAVEAIFAASDLLALSALSAATSLGRDVPEKLAVVGFDDIPIAAYYNPALSTVRQDIRAGGRILTETLFARLAGGTLQSTTLPTQLVLRQTTRPPKRPRTGRRPSLGRGRRA